MKQRLSFLLLFYFRFLAKLQLLKNSKATIIGVTGSAGKSSTIEALQAVLKPHFRVKTTGGSNSESGIPLSILGLKANNYSLFDWLRLCLLAPIKLLTNWEKFDIFLVEMGIDAPTPPKNMDYLLSIVKPAIGVFLNVSPVHLLNFKNLDQIAQQKAKLINNSQTAVINLNDPLVKKYTTNKNIIPITPITIPFLKLPSIYAITFGAAIAVSQKLNIQKSTALKNLQNNFKLPPGRSSILKGINNSTLIDSSYNSSPLACQEMLNFLKTFPCPRLAILGDMRELGLATEKSHQKIYKTALNTADQIISIGPETTKYFGDKAIKFLYWWQAADYLKNVILACLPASPEGPESKPLTILIKGSQNTIFLEELVKNLLQNSSDAHFLCRQSPYWLKLKNDFRNKNSV